MPQQHTCGPECAGYADPPQQPAENQAEGATGSGNVGGETSDNVPSRFRPQQPLINTPPSVKTTPQDISNARMANPQFSSLTDDHLRAFIFQIKQRQIQNQVQRDGN
ncbi:hypothetical protein CKAH01_14057 [Colletotrichum kahawae]|uniref:Uncharacterized protein n=1 Tax=Colletotrichum kahawae TaxID=34407 RepID=A0AAE0D942_COLKA|nr:hypothetical protein CKAH01_14057 [Colletotrichum kahawae]